MKKIFIEDLPTDDFKKLVSKMNPKDLVSRKKNDNKYLWLILAGALVAVIGVAFIVVKILRNNDEYDDEFFDDDDEYLEDEYDENGCLYTASDDFE